MWVKCLHKPGVLGCVSGNCLPFYLYLFKIFCILLCTSQYILVHYSISRLYISYISVYYSTFQYITVYYSILQYITVHYSTFQYISSLHFSILQDITVQFSILQYIMANTYVFSGFSRPTWCSGWPRSSRSTSKLSYVYIVACWIILLLFVCL